MGGQRADREPAIMLSPRITSVERRFGYQVSGLAQERRKFDSSMSLPFRKKSAHGKATRRQGAPGDKMWQTANNNSRAQQSSGA
jgi:hypothetical protein